MNEVQEAILLGAKEIHNLREENKKQYNLLKKIKDKLKELKEYISQRINLLEESKKTESMYGEVTTKLDELYCIYGELNKLLEEIE